MINFTPISASLGGALIGISAVMLMALNGRIAGISGIVSGTLFSSARERMWRICFIAGLIVAPLVVQSFSELLVFQVDAGPVVIIIAGLLVGFGTALGSGCTSGHGVCGLSRLSPRSVVAVAIFMCVGIATASISRQISVGLQ